MKSLLNRIATLGAAGLLAGAASLAAATTLPGPVVTTQWLADNLDKVQVVELRGSAKSFTTPPEIETDDKTGKKSIEEIGGHIPGSRLMEWRAVRVKRKIRDVEVSYMIPERAEFEKMVQAAGIDAGKPIVVVPVGLAVSDVSDAARLYWQFKVYGEDQIALLDGGMAQWLLDGRPYSTDAPAAKTGTWTSAADRSAQFMVDAPDVAQAIEKKTAQLVDARELNQFHGLVKRDYVYGFGHLEGAKSLPPELVHRKAGSAVRLLAPATYKAVLAAQGIDAAAPTIVYCNSGAQTGLPWFVMSEILGNKNAKQYDGSLHQWTLEKRTLVGAVPLN